MAMWDNGASFACMSKSPLHRGFPTTRESAARQWALIAAERQIQSQVSQPLGCCTQHKLAVVERRGQEQAQRFLFFLADRVPQICSVLLDNRIVGHWQSPNPLATVIGCLRMFRGGSLQPGSRIILSLNPTSSNNAANEPNLGDDLKGGVRTCSMHICDVIRSPGLRQGRKDMVAAGRGVLTRWCPAAHEAARALGGSWMTTPMPCCGRWLRIWASQPRAREMQAWVRSEGSRVNEAVPKI